MLRILTLKPYFLVPTSQRMAPMQKSTMNTAAPANLFMRNKPNLCVFWAVSGDCEEKQTQSNPISPHKIAKIPCSTVHLSTVLRQSAQGRLTAESRGQLSQAKGLPQTQSNPTCHGLPSGGFFGFFGLNKFLALAGSG